MRWSGGRQRQSRRGAGDRLAVATRCGAVRRGARGGARDEEARGMKGGGSRPQASFTTRLRSTMKCLCSRLPVRRHRPSDLRLSLPLTQPALALALSPSLSLSLSFSILPSSPVSFHRPHLPPLSRSLSRFLAFSAAFNFSLGFSR